MSAAVSVVIPAHNAAAFLGDAVRSALAQTCPADEIIVVDDGSTDATPAVARGFGPRVSLISTPVARGPSAARNAGIEHARGDLIALLDADDLWETTRLERMLPACRDGAALVCCDARYLVDGRIQPETILGDRIATLPDALAPVPSAFERLIGDNFVITSSVVITRHALQAAGGFDPSLRSVEDRDLWIRVAAEAPVWFTRAPLVIKRGRRDALSRNHVLAALSRLRVMRKVRAVYPARVRAMGASWRVHLADALADAAYACRLDGRPLRACACYAESFALRPRLLPLRGIAGAVLGGRRRARAVP